MFPKILLKTDFYGNFVLGQTGLETSVARLTNIDTYRHWSTPY